MIPVPDLRKAEVVFGHIKHLPKWEDIPEDFRDNWHSQRNAYCHFVSMWFSVGRKPEDMARLTEKPGVDRNKALAAIKAALGSWEPKHEHKIAGVGYLLSEWFDLAPELKR